MDSSSFFTIIQTIVLLLLVIGIANISLRYLNKHMNRHNKLIRIVERVAVGNNSSLAIVEICGDYYLMSFTASDNRILERLDTKKAEEMVKIVENGKK